MHNVLVPQLHVAPADPGYIIYLFIFRGGGGTGEGM